MSTTINTKLLREQRNALLDITADRARIMPFSPHKIDLLNGIIAFLDHTLDVQEGYATNNEQEGVAWLSNELAKAKQQAKDMQACLTILRGTLEYYVAFGRDLPLSDATMILEMVNSVPAMQENKKEQETNKHAKESSKNS